MNYIKALIRAWGPKENKNLILQKKTKTISYLIKKVIQSNHQHQRARNLLRMILIQIPLFQKSW